MANGDGRLDLDGRPIKPLTICMIGAGGFIGSHLCEKLMTETPHKVLALDVYNDKIKHLLEPDTVQWAGRIQFHRINIKHDSRLEGLIKMADLVLFLRLFLVNRLCECECECEALLLAIIGILFKLMRDNYGKFQVIVSAFTDFDDYRLRSDLLWEIEF